MKNKETISILLHDRIRSGECCQRNKDASRKQDSVDSTHCANVTAL